MDSFTPAPRVTTSSLPSGDLEPALNAPWGSAATMPGMLHALTQMLPAALTIAAAAIFAAMFWANSRAH